MEALPPPTRSHVGWIFRSTVPSHDGRSGANRSAHGGPEGPPYATESSPMPGAPRDAPSHSRVKPLVVDGWPGSLGARDRCLLHQLPSVERRGEVTCLPACVCRDDCAARLLDGVPGISPTSRRWDVRRWRHRLSSIGHRPSGPSHGAPRDYAGTCRVRSQGASEVTPKEDSVQSRISTVYVINA